MLYEMGPTMERMGDLLDGLLGTELFYHLHEVIEQCANLMALRNHIHAAEWLEALTRSEN